MSVIGKHWRGEYSLPVSYWLNSVLIGSILGFAFTWFANNFEIILTPYLRPQGVMVVFFAFFAVYLICVIIMLVGVWRSAYRRIRDREGNRFWAVVAMLLVALVSIALCFNLWAGFTGKEILVSGSDRAMHRATMPKVEAVLKTVALQMQDGLPKKLDKITELTAVKADGATLNYYYTISPPSTLPRIKFSILKANSLKVTCTNMNDVNLLQRGASYNMWYTDGVSQPRNRITVKGSDCYCIKKDGYGDCLAAEVMK